MSLRTLPIALAGLALAGCLAGPDGAAEAEPVQATPITRPAPADLAARSPGTTPVTTTPTSDDPAVEDPTATVPPVAVAPGDATHSVCANALPLPEGTLAAQDLSLGAEPAAGSCIATRPTSLFYAVTIPARSVYVVDAQPEADDAALSLYAATTCQPPADGSCTYLDSTHPGEPLRLTNATDAPRRAVFAVQAENAAALARFDLTLTRDALAPNAVCEDAVPLALDGTATDVATAFGGPTAPDVCPHQRSHFYRVTVPARTRVIASVTADAPVYANFLTDGCGAVDGCYGDSTFANTDEVPREVVLAVSQVTSTEGTFSLALSSERVAPNASCEAAARLPLGTVVTADTGGGGRNLGCAACFGQLAIFYTVDVPAGAVVEVTAAPVVATESWNSAFVTSASACDSWDCGFPTTFVEGGTTRLRLDNSEGDAAQSYVLTAGKALLGDEVEPAERSFTLEAHVVE
ncbi:MAG: hypothetical protein EP329_24460 [Deltaproteobacteria bacterium]|nr:MAG: hypothetical protein EP329_24460 [Deltaproteobacteria bacterium]